jgi:holo-[acyl-carrier protein] synthase
VIVGVGIDIVDVSRIERLLKQYGGQFAGRILCGTEREGFDASNRQALGTGLRYPVTLQAISVTNDSLGKPMFGFHGPLPQYLASRGVRHSHLGLSHEKGMACAMVVLEQ